MYVCGILFIINYYDRVEFAELDKKYKPLNLGLGAPDFCPPSILTSALEEISKIEDHTLHQYARAYVSVM